MELKQTLKKYQTGEISIEGLKAELKNHREELAKAFEKEGLTMTDRIAEKTDRLASAGAWMQDVFLAVNGARTGASYANDARDRLSKWKTKAAMNEGTASQGGVLVPDELQADIFEVIETVSVTMAGMTQYTMASDTKIVPKTGTIPTSLWHKEGDTIEVTDPTFEQITLLTKRLDGASPASNELIEDADVSVLAYLTRMFAVSAGQAVDSTVFGGNASAAFSGIFSADGAAYSVVLDAGSTNFSAVTVINLIDLYAKFPTWVTRGGAGKVFLSPLVRSYLAKEKQAGLYLMNPYQTNGPGQFSGLPFVESDQAPSSSAAETACIAIAYMRNIILGNRMQMSLLVDPYSLSLSNQTRFVAVQRLALALGSTKGFGRVVTHA